MSTTIQQDTSMIPNSKQQKVLLEFIEDIRSQKMIGFDMEYSLDIIEDENYRSKNTFETKQGCGTVCCIAGSIFYNRLLKIPKSKGQYNALFDDAKWNGFSNENIKKRYSHLLERHSSINAVTATEIYLDSLNPKGEVNWNNLFYLENWPAKFENKYWQCTTRNQRLKITEKRILHFIKTGE